MKSDSCNNPPLPKTLAAFLWHFMKKDWKEYAAIQFFSFAWSLDHTLWPLVIMLFIDAITSLSPEQPHVWSVIATPVWLGLGLWLTVELFFRLAGILAARMIPKLEAEIRMAMFDYVQHHSYRYFSNNLAGSLANKISDMPQSATRLIFLLVYLFFPVLLAILIAVALFAWVNAIFAFILIAWVLVHLSICFYFSKGCDKYSHVHSEARTTLAGKIVDSFLNSINVRLFGRNRFEKEYLERFQKDEQEKHWELLWYIEKMKIALGFASFFGAGLALNGFIIYSWLHSTITTGEIVLIFNASWNVVIMVWIAGLELPSLFKEIGICNQALTIIQDPHELIDEPHAKELKVKRGEITFDKVSFHYVPDYNIFQDKTITIHAGEKVGLVGYSGSGKTTFVNLILRYFDVEKGRILIDGQDIFEMTQDSLREQIAMIPQDPSLFHRSILENIRYGRLDATEAEIVEACKKAHCHEFIQRLSEGYHTLAGERGIKLSGGQRQRIAIARAILKDAPILILDEATSALDSVTEKHIQEGMEALMKDRTTIVIAHRLSTLSGMDRILVFKEGKIVEDGTHQELLEAGGHYAYLWQMQAGGFLPDDLDEESEEPSK